MRLNRSQRPFQSGEREAGERGRGVERENEEKERGGEGERRGKEGEERKSKGRKEEERENWVRGHRLAGLFVCF